MNKSAYLKPVDIYGLASCIGAQNVRCYSAPLVLQSLDLAQKLAQKNIPATWIKTFLLEQSAETSQDKYAIIAELSRQLAEHVAKSVQRNHRFLTIGGDHSCAIGTWSGAATALRDKGDLGLIWIDAHLDAHTPETTPSGAVHGMPVAALLGYGADILTHIGDNRPKIKPENICLLGARSYEPEERDLLESLGVKVYFMADIQEQGLHKVFQAALQQVRQNTCAFGISLDLDAIDPQEAPGVGSPVAKGIHADELLAVFRELALSEQFLGFELAELNVFEDKGDRTAQLALDLIESIFEE